MKKSFLLLIFSIMLLSGCNQSDNSKETPVINSSQVKIVLKGEEITLSQPLLIRKDVVYITISDLASLPGITTEYTQTDGKVIAARGEASFTLTIGQPLKEGDKNGPRPFLQQDMVYIPFCDTINRLNYKAETETSPDGTLIITLEKLGFDFVDYLDMLTADKFSDVELRAAETALAQGVTITDPENDWAPISEGIQEDGRMDNDKPYPISFTDIKSVTFGADSQYFYLKFEFYGVIPDDMLVYENTDLGKTDFISGIGASLGLRRFYNRNTGKDDEGGMQISISYVQGDNQRYSDTPNLLVPPVVSIENQATLSGRKYENGDDIYAVSDSNGQGAGGAGTNYLMGAFPLSEYGLWLGDIIEGSLGIEVGSKLFHHESIDVVLDCGYKAGATIRYQLGAGTWENLGPSDKLLPLNTPVQGK
jgi:hypothetical protein